MSEHTFLAAAFSNEKTTPGAVLDGGILGGFSFYAADMVGCSLRNVFPRR